LVKSGLYSHEKGGGRDLLFRGERIEGKEERQQKHWEERPSEPWKKIQERAPNIKGGKFFEKRGSGAARKTQ